MSIKTSIIDTRIYLYKNNKFYKNVPFFIRALNLIFSEKHICRFTPLVLSFPEWHLPGGEILSSPMSGLRLLLFTNLKQISNNIIIIEG